MNKFLLLVSFLYLASFSGFSQSMSKERKNITEHLSSSTDGKGVVHINQPSQLDSLLLNNSHSSFYKENNEHEAYITTRGYRIQIFSGNNQRESKNEAYRKETQVNELFTTLDSYVTFQSPFWKLRVGNFRTAEEAHAFLRELKKAFPTWKEMFIVKENIKFPIN